WKEGSRIDVVQSSAQRFDCESSAVCFRWRQMTQLANHIFAAYRLYFVDRSTDYQFSKNRSSGYRRRAPRRFNFCVDEQVVLEPHSQPDPIKTDFIYHVAYARRRIKLSNVAWVCYVISDLRAIHSTMTAKLITGKARYLLSSLL